MSKPNSTDPYQPPLSNEGTTGESPSPKEILAAAVAVVAVLFGGIVFVGTCLGGGFLAFDYVHGSHYGSR
jgi:hypothetical protein